MEAETILGCLECGTYDAHPPCENCGVPIHIGSDYRCPHEKALPARGFEPHFDAGLGKHVTGWGDINAACRPHWENDHIVHVQPRDKPASYYRELADRRAARAEAARKEAR